MASAPPLMPTPNWWGWRSVAASWLQCRQHTLDARRRVRSPHAMGRSPPSFFLRAERFAPASHGAMDGGAFPARRMLRTVVVEEIAFCAEAEHGALNASMRWAGRSPDGPGLEDLGMELAAFCVALLDICSAGGWEERERGCERPCGCLSCMVAMVEADAVARPCDVNAEQARERLPSDAWRRAHATLSDCWCSCDD